MEQLPDDLILHIKSFTNVYEYTEEYETDQHCYRLKLLKEARQKLNDKQLIIDINLVIKKRRDILKKVLDKYQEIDMKKINEKK